jgi:hypothetical protein
MFAGLKLNARSVSPPEVATQKQPVERLRPSEIERAVDRYARAVDAAGRNARDGVPVLEAQKREIRDAGLGLDQAQPRLQALIRSALQNDPQTERAMSELSGRERAALSDPNVRADRFVNRWQELQGQLQELRGWQHDEARKQVEGQMQGMAKSLERDPQVESLLRNRSHELGVRQRSQGQSLAQDMERSLTQSRGMGMER